MQLHHQFIGNPQSKKLIVFLHEGLGSIKQWKQFPEKLCAKCNAYGLVYDRSGYGQSPGSLTKRKPDYLHKSALELRQVIDDLVSTEYDLYLYGHSDGGSIALIYAANYKTNLKGIITEAAHVFVEEETLIGVAETLPLFEAGKFDGLSKYHGNRYKEVFMAWNTIWLHPDFRNWNITEALHKITCPQLIIQGINDQYGTIAQVEAIANKTEGKSFTFTPEDCGHTPHKEKQTEVLTTVKQFMANFN